MKKYGEKNMKYSYSDMKIFDCCLIYLITPPTFPIFSTKSGTSEAQTELLVREHLPLTVLNCIGPPCEVAERLKRYPNIH